MSFSLSHAMVYQCEFENGFLSYIGEVYQCKDPIIADFGDGKNLANITGYHESGKSHEDVKGVYAGTSLNTTNFPRDFGEFFPNLIYLGYLNTKFTSISSEDLRNLPSLKRFYIANSNLISIEGDLFKHSPSLRWIRFLKNPFEHVGHNLLSGLYRLESVGMYNNNCINQTADTPEAIREIIRILPIQCPPLPSTETTTISTSTWTPAPDSCPASCIDKIEQIENEIVLLKAQNDRERLELKAEMSRQSSRIEKLEHLVRERTEWLLRAPVEMIKASLK
jgi:hypothetical protein